MSKETDAFDLSDEDFDKVMSGESDEFILGASDEEFEETDEDLNEDSDGDSDEDSEDFLDLFSSEDSDEEPDSDEDSSDDSDSKSEEMIELVHKGELVKVTRAEAINLAQQGYDYLEKTTRIAPHRKLLELIEADEELKNKINQHVASKMAPEVTKREDYDTEEEWLASNMANAIASTNPTVADAVPQEPTGQEAPIVTALRNRDPENFNKVGPVLKQVIERLTIGQYQEITSDPQKVVQFYDNVKQHVLAGRTVAQPSQTKTAPKKKTFNLRSGQGPSKSRTPKKKNVWDLGNKEFSSVLKKVKGY